MSFFNFQFLSFLPLVINIRLNITWCILHYHNIVVWLTLIMWFYFIIAIKSLYFLLLLLSLLSLSIFSILSIFISFISLLLLLLLPSPSIALGFVLRFVLLSLLLVSLSVLLLILLF